MQCLQRCGHTGFWYSRASSSASDCRNIAALDDSDSDKDANVQWERHSTDLIGATGSDYTSTYLSEVSSASSLVSRVEEAEEDSEGHEDELTRAERLDREEFEALPDRTKTLLETKALLDSEEGEARAHMWSLAMGEDTNELRRGYTKRATELQELKDRRLALGNIENDAHHLQRKIQAWDFLQELHAKDPRALPTWAYDPRGVSTHPGFVTGPANTWLRLSMVARIISSVIGFMSSWHFSSNTTGTYPLILWMLFVPAGLLKFFAERKGLRLFLVPYSWRQLETKEKLFVILCKEVHYKIWLAFHGWISFMSWVDDGADSLWLGAMVALLSGPYGKKITRAWLASSFLEFLPCLSLKWVMIIAWAVQLVNPCLLGFQGLRWEEFERGRDPLHVFGRAGGGHTLWANVKIFNDDVFSLLAEGDDACTLQTLTSRAQYAQMRRTPALEYSLRSINTLGKQMVGRVLTSYLLDNCVQMNLQSGMFAIRVAGVIPELPPNYFQSLLALGSTIFGTFLKIPEVVRFEIAVRRFQVVMEHTAKCGALDPLEREFVIQKTKLLRALWFVRCATGLTVLNLCVGLCQLVSCVMCSDSLWNPWLVLEESRGCVDVSGVVS